MKLLLTSLALLLVCASSGFASILIEAPWDYSNPTRYTNGNTVNLTFGTELNPAAPGTGTMNLHLDILAVNSWNTGVNLKQKFQVTGEQLINPFNVYSVKVDSGTVFSYDFAVTPATPGIYDFELLAKSTFAAATAEWSINKAQLTNSQPSNTPLPAAIVLFGSGLVGLFGVNKARRRKTFVEA